MVGRELTHMFPKGRCRIGDVVLSVRDLALEGVFKDVSFDLRRGEILGIAGLVGAGRTNVAETIFGVTPATAGEIRIDGKPVTVSSPKTAMDHGLALLTEDRKASGLFLMHSVLENMQIASVRTHTSSGFVKQGALNTPLHQAPRHAADQDADAERDHRQPQRRQSAEGADRPLADDQPAHPDPG